MKQIALFFILACVGCVNFDDRQKDLQKKYPKAVITPATSLLANQGYQFLMEDTINNQLFAVSYYTFSTSKISTIRNVK
jgi:hypothetical protein